MSTVPALDELRSVSRPVLYRTHIADAPFGVWGSSFLVGHSSYTYVITARHIIRECPTSDILIFPSDRSRIPLSLTDRITFEEDPEDQDSTDLIVFRAPIERVKKNDKRRSRVIDLNNIEGTNWLPTRFNSEMFLAGYPRVGTSVDYNTSIATTKQIFLSGRYVGPFVSGGCHELQLRNPTCLADFDGLSGSPVFSVQIGIGIGYPARFCGMVIRAGAQSGKAYFLEAETILLAVNNARDA